MDTAALAGLDRAALVAEFERLFRRLPPARTGRDLMARAVAYKMQELEGGALKTVSKRQLASLIANRRATGMVKVSGRRQLGPGTRLMREWRGSLHEVMVTADGFEYRGVGYRSLSRIAREITGSARSGPAFFGLNRLAASIGSEDGK